MAQPQWITKAGSLGTIPENVFYQVPVTATDPDDGTVYYRLIAGQLPDGIQVQKTGIINGVPTPTAIVRGVPIEVSRDITSKFAIRAYTETVVNGVVVVDRFADRTFELTVTGQDAPTFVTPAGLVGTFFDGTEISIQIEITDPDPSENIVISVLTGSLPPGLVMSRHGLITGVLEPLLASENYAFTLQVTDGKDSNIRAFNIQVYSRATMTADNTYVTADNTFITADSGPIRPPILLNTPGSLGRIRSDNFYAYKFEGVDFDDDPITYEFTSGVGVGFDAPGTSYDEDGVSFDQGGFSLPPNLTINSTTGWLYGYIADNGATELTYRFALRLKKTNQPTIVSPYYYFTITIIGNIETEVIWLTNPDLGTINNGAVSTFEVAAVNTGGRELQYRIVSGSDSKLPQGLTLKPSGHITGTVSFNTFAVDGGTTTFDTNLDTRLNIDGTTFDMKFDFTVNAYASQSETLGYRVASIRVVSGGSGYLGQPRITISAPPTTENAVQATGGACTIVGGQITAIAVGNPGRGYLSPPTITLEGGDATVDATAVAEIEIVDITNPVSVFRTFSITVVRAFNEPYESLYIKAMPPQADRELIDQLVQNQDYIPVSAVYRADDLNFGVSQSVVYNHAYGLTASSIDKYAESLNLNHYWKHLTLGTIKSARALDSAGQVLYEVIYSTVIDNLVNSQGQSVSKQVTLPYPVNPGDSTEIDVVYPNSLINMRNQVIDQIGQISPALPLWMTSKQSNGQVLGFVPAWVIAYVKPGQSARVLYNIQQGFGNQLNKIDFKADRYELNRSQTHSWLPFEDSTDAGHWIPHPPVATIFDNNTTVFDGTATRFISPADQYTTTDVFDKYLLFPKTNILG